MSALRANITRCVIFGAGGLGHALYSSLEEFGVKTDFFIDENADTFSFCDDAPRLVKPGDPLLQGAGGVAFIALADEGKVETARRKIPSAFTTVISDRDAIGDIIRSACNRRHSFRPERCACCPLLRPDGGGCETLPRVFPNDPLLVPSAGVLVTSRCNLRCVGCNHLREHFGAEHSYDVPARLVLGDLEAFLSGVDFLFNLTVVGGEAFLHPHLDEILLGISALPKIGRITLISNGVAMPTDAVLGVLAATPRIGVIFSGYDGVLPDALMRRFRAVTERLRGAGVKFKVMIEQEWKDLGGLSPRPYSAEQAESIYASCCLKTNDIFDGKLHKCSRSVFGLAAGLFDVPKDDYVDLRADGVGKAGEASQKMRRAVRRFLALRSVSACLRCDGTEYGVIKAGVQG
ncbi:MAG: radical SAM protein [Synergistaceae bacterium]|jgi:MoaA/NifB/PqqE/SkfB family radical SAM enzyme|nr:radical SAM protein [Synergistaceae bacterium]